MAIPHNAYRCKGDNRWCVIAVFTDEEWGALCQVIGNPEWTTASKFTTFLERKANEEEIDSLIEKWTINRTAEEVMHKMQTVGVPAGVVKNTKDVFEDEQLRHYRKLFPKVSHYVLGDYIPGIPSFILSKTPFVQQQPAPCLGEHNEYVCKKLLGMSDEEIVDFLESGAME